MIYVWALEQQKLKYKEQDVFVPWQLQKRYGQFKQSQQKDQSNVVELNNKTGELVYKRYYHLFKKGELEELVSKLGDLISIEESAYEHDNWCVIIKKKKE